MVSILRRRKLLLLLPPLAALLALAGAAPLSGARQTRAAPIQAEDWTQRADDRDHAGSMVERYMDRYRTRSYDSPQYVAGFEFNAVASVWQARLGRGTLVRLFLRTSRDGASWSNWTAVETDGRAATHTGTNYGALQVMRGAFLQYRLQLVAPLSAPLPELSTLSLTLINSRQATGAGLSRLGVARAAEPAPAVISRAAWGASESLRFDGAGGETWPRQYRTPRKAILHDTQTINDDPDPAATVRAIYYYHTVVRGWGDIGYNYLVDGQGRVYEGRAGGPGVVGAHARCYNWGTIGVAALGEYSRREPSAALVDSIERLLAWRLEAHGIDPLGRGSLGGEATRDIANIASHADLLGSCGNSHPDPGLRLRERIGEIRRDVALRIGSDDAPPPSPPRPEAGRGEPSYTVSGTGGRGLYLRALPGMTGRPLAVVPEGAVVHERTSPIDGWVKTSYSGVTGYLWHEYLREIPGSRLRRGGASPGDPRPAPRGRARLTPGGSAVISGTPGALNLRTGPGSSYRSIARMWEGLGVEVTGEPRGGWYPVRYTAPGGRVLTGWAWGEYLRPGRGRSARTAWAMALAGALALPARGARHRRTTATGPNRGS